MVAPVVRVFDLHALRPAARHLALREAPQQRAVALEAQRRLARARGRCPPGPGGECDSCDEEPDQGEAHASASIPPPQVRGMGVEWPGAQPEVEHASDLDPETRPSRSARAARGPGSRAGGRSGADPRRGRGRQLRRHHGTHGDVPGPPAHAGRGGLRGRRQDRRGRPRHDRGLDRRGRPRAHALRRLQRRDLRPRGAGLRAPERHGRRAGSRASRQLPDGLAADPRDGQPLAGRDHAGALGRRRRRNRRDADRQKDLARR